METSLLPTQAAKQANLHEDIFHRQKAYFATNITKSFEWRVDQLNRLAQLLSEHTNEFYDALSRDFKTALSEKAFEVANGRGHQAPAGCFTIRESIRAGRHFTGRSPRGISCCGD